LHDNLPRFERIVVDPLHGVGWRADLAEEFAVDVKERADRFVLGCPEHLGDDSNFRDDAGATERRCNVDRPVGSSGLERVKRECWWFGFLLSREYRVPTYSHADAEPE
jgi:hypothetical protein